MKLQRRPLEEQRAYFQGADLALRSAMALLREHPEAQKIVSQFRETQRLICEAMDPSPVSEAGPGLPPHDCEDPDCPAKRRGAPAAKGGQHGR